MKPAKLTRGLNHDYQISSTGVSPTSLFDPEPQFVPAHYERSQDRAESSALQPRLACSPLDGICESRVVLAINDPPLNIIIEAQ
jgi:hypothetical protein